MTTIGITGGIASGKSTVTDYLQKKGYAVIDADSVVHDLQAKGGKLYAVLVDWLGEDVLQADEELNRPKLAQLIFSNPDYLEKSAQLQNPIIRQELADRLADAQAKYEIVFLDIPLLFEQGYADWCDQVWLVYVDEETQLDRLMNRNGYSRKEARQRIASQMSLEEKKEKANVMVDNNGGIEELYHQLDFLLNNL